MADAVENGTAPAHNEALKTPAPFGEALRTALRSTGTTPAELARLTERSSAAVSQWLHGKNVPSIQIIFTIEEHLHLRRGELANHVMDRDWWAERVQFPTLEENFAWALRNHPRLDEEQKVMISQVVDRFIKLNELMGHASGSQPATADTSRAE